MEPATREEVREAFSEPSEDIWRILGPETGRRIRADLGEVFDAWLAAERKAAVDEVVPEGWHVVSPKYMKQLKQAERELDRLIPKRWETE